ncbi:MAG: hypothetical protein ACFFC7_21885 [Candidatus Hermodarchaeota archaeon]
MSVSYFKRDLDSVLKLFEFKKILNKKFLPLWSAAIFLFVINFVWALVSLFIPYLPLTSTLSQAELNEFRPFKIFTILMPWGNIILDWIISDIFLIIICTIIVYTLLATFFARALVLRVIKLQKITLKERKLYILPNPNEKRGMGLLFSRAVLPILVALGISVYGANLLPEIVKYFATPQPGWPPILNEMNQAIVLVYFMVPLLAIVLPGAWLLDDLGVIAAESPNVGSLEVRRQGKDFLAILKIFAGISVIIAYFRLAINALPSIRAYSSMLSFWDSYYGPGISDLLGLVFYLIVLINPWILITGPLIALMLYEVNVDKLKEALKEKLIKEGFEIIDYSKTLEEIKTGIEREKG